MTAFPQPPRRPYAKPWCSHRDQVVLLQQRGLVIADPVAAAGFLQHINYYRFSGYCLAFEQARHRFLPDTTFEQIQAACEFDRVLRDLATEALEIVELDLRSVIAYHFGRQHGAFGHTSPAWFFHRFKHREWIDKLHEEARRSSELFVTHFKATYAEFPDLPIWMATEAMSFGALSQMLSGMTHRDQKAVSVRYGVQHRVLASWMHHLVYVRNLCAHHSRLWDRIWSIKPTLPAGVAWGPPYLPGNNRLFATLLILCSLLKRCPTMTAFTTEWRQRVERLLAAPPSAAKACNLMGLTANWKTHPRWI
jgi:abortive infection bacteriophage resistance protein